MDKNYGKSVGSSDPCTEKLASLMMDETIHLVEEELKVWSLQESYLWVLKPSIGQYIQNGLNNV
jgi:hypothetical protein